MDYQNIRIKAQSKGKWIDQGSPEHDKLVMAAMSKAGRERIIEACGLKDISIDDKERIESHSKKTFTKCSLQQICNISDLDDPCRSCEARSYIQGQHSRYCNGDFKQKVKLNLGSIDTYIENTYTAEHVLKGGYNDYIIGYIDAVITVSKYIHYTEISEGSGTPIRADGFELDYYIIVEVKPHITSIGDTIRQLKTYTEAFSEYCDKKRMVIVSYDQLSDEQLEFLGNENISVITFPEEY